MALTYSSLVTALSTLTAIDATDTNFLTILPQAIEYANNRICRELDLIVENVRDSTSSTTALNRNFTLPTTNGTFQIVTGINIITPASTAPDSGTRNPCTPVSLDVLDLIWPSTTGATAPTMFNYFSQADGQTGIIFGPWPDTTYRVEVIGKVIPAPISATNTTTFVTTYLGDLFIAACMIFMTGYLKNFGAQGDDPKQAQSWESQYQALAASAQSWEARKRFGGASWTSRQIESTAQPQRG